MPRSRLAIWAIVILSISGAVIGGQKSVMAWLSKSFWTGGPEYALTHGESEFVAAAWSRVESRPNSPMLSIPFEIGAESPVTGTESITIENTSSSVIHNVWFHREDMPNFYNAEALVRSVTADRQTETEKVIALWELFPKYYYNYNPLPTTGMLVDPPTLLSVLGTAQCNYAANVLSTLCQLAGCETRLVGIELVSPDGVIEHCAMEVKADGKWIFMDPDGHAVYKRADGGWASAADLIRDASPVRAAPHAYFNPALLAQAFAKGTVTFYDHDWEDSALAKRQTDPARFSTFRHIMRYDLLPGAKTTLYPHQMGRYLIESFPLYCNGWLHWTCRPSDFESGTCDGMILQNLDVSVREDKAVVLTPSHSRHPAALVLPLTSPYLMVGGRIIGDIESQALDGGKVQVYALPFLRPPYPAGFGWSRVAAVQGSFSVSYDEMFAHYPLFGYALKLEIPSAGVVIHSLDVLSELQASPRALPYLVQGQNRFTLYSEKPTSPLGVETAAEGGKDVWFDNGLRITLTPAKRTYPPTTVFPDGRVDGPIAPASENKTALPSAAVTN